MSVVLSTYHILRQEDLCIGTSTKDMNTNHIQNVEQKGTYIMRITDQDHIPDILFQGITRIQKGGSRIRYQK